MAIPDPYDFIAATEPDEEEPATTVIDPEEFMAQMSGMPQAPAASAIPDPELFIGQVGPIGDTGITRLPMEQLAGPRSPEAEQAMIAQSQRPDEFRENLLESAVKTAAAVGDATIKYLVFPWIGIEDFRRKAMSAIKDEEPTKEHWVDKTSIAYWIGKAESQQFVDASAQYVQAIKDMPEHQIKALAERFPEGIPPALVLKDEGQARVMEKVMREGDPFINHLLTVSDEGRRIVEHPFKYVFGDLTGLTAVTTVLGNPKEAFSEDPVGSTLAMFGAVGALAGGLGMVAKTGRAMKGMQAAGAPATLIGKISEVRRRLAFEMAQEPMATAMDKAAGTRRAAAEAKAMKLESEIRGLQEQMDVTPEGQYIQASRMTQLQEELARAKVELEEVRRSELSAGVEASAQARAKRLLAGEEPPAEPLKTGERPLRAAEGPEQTASSYAEEYNQRKAKGIYDSSIKVIRSDDFTDKILLLEREAEAAVLAEPPRNIPNYAQEVFNVRAARPAYAAARGLRKMVEGLFDEGLNPTARMGLLGTGMTETIDAVRDSALQKGVGVRRAFVEKLRPVLDDLRRAIPESPNEVQTQVSRLMDAVEMMEHDRGIAFEMLDAIDRTLGPELNLMDAEATIGELTLGLPRELAVGNRLRANAATRLDVLPEAEAGDLVAADMRDQILGVLQRELKAGTLFKKSRPGDLEPPYAFDEARRVVEAMPEHMWQYLRELRIQDAGVDVTQGATWSGQYTPERGLARVRPGQNPEVTIGQGANRLTAVTDGLIQLSRTAGNSPSHTLAHEIGHFVQNFVPDSELAALRAQFTLERQVLPHPTNPAYFDKIMAEWWAEKFRDIVRRRIRINDPQFEIKIGDVFKMTVKNDGFVKAVRTMMLRTADVVNGLYRYYARGGVPDHAGKLIKQFLDGGLTEWQEYWKGVKPGELTQLGQALGLRKGVPTPRPYEWHWTPDSPSGFGEAVPPAVQLRSGERPLGPDGKPVSEIGRVEPKPQKSMAERLAEIEQSVLESTRQPGTKEPFPKIKMGAGDVIPVTGMSPAMRAKVVKAISDIRQYAEKNPNDVQGVFQQIDNMRLEAEIAGELKDAVSQTAMRGTISRLELQAAMEQAPFKAKAMLLEETITRLEDMYKRGEKGALTERQAIRGLMEEKTLELDQLQKQALIQRDMMGAESRARILQLQTELNQLLDEVRKGDHLARGNQIADASNLWKGSKPQKALSGAQRMVKNFLDNWQDTELAAQRAEVAELLGEGDPAVQRGLWDKVSDASYRMSKWMYTMSRAKSAIRSVEGEAAWRIMTQLRDASDDLKMRWYKSMTDQGLDALARDLVNDPQGHIKFFSDPRVRSIMDDVFDEAEKRGVLVIEEGKDGKWTTRAIRKVKDYIPRVLRNDIVDALWRGLVKLDEDFGANNDVLTLVGETGSTDAAQALLAKKKIVEIFNNAAIPLAERQYLQMAVQHLKRTGQAADDAEALIRLRWEVPDQRMRTFSNLEFARRLELPLEWYESDPMKLMVRYIEGASQRLAEYNVVGRDYSKFDAILQQIKNPAEKRIMQKFFLRMTGTDPNNIAGPVLRWMNRNTAKYAYNFKIGMGMSFIPQMTQPLISFIPKWGVKRFAELQRDMMRGSKHEAATMDFLRDVSSKVDIGIRMMARDASLSSKMGRLFERVALPKKIFEVENRLFDFWSAGIYDRAYRDLIKIATEGKGERALWARRTLWDTFDTRLEDVIGMDINSPEMRTRRIHAARQGARESQLHRDVLNEPLWMSDVRWQWMLSLKRFQIKQAMYIYDTLVGEAARGNIMPAFRLAAGGALGGWGVEKLRQMTTSALSGMPEYTENRESWNEIFYRMSLLGTFGAAGSFFDIDPYSSKSYEELAGNIVFLALPVGANDAMEMTTDMVDFLDMWNNYDLSTAVEQKGLDAALTPLGSVPRQIARRAKTETQMEAAAKSMRNRALDRMKNMVLDGKRDMAQEERKRYNEAIKRTGIGAKYLIDWGDISAAVQARKRRKRELQRDD